METRSWLAVWTGAALLAACVTSPMERATSLAARAGLRPFPLEVQGFRLTGFLKQTNPEPDPLVVLIEGDGLAWRDRNTPSGDPTPVKAVSLELALANPAPDFFYMARLCQFDGRQSPLCQVEYWTSHRYSDAVVIIHDSALDRIKAATHARSLALVGHSGGGTLATLLAARRRDVVWLVTLAANLDLDAWTTSHGVSSMPDSLNPTRFVSHLKKLPQWHFVGGEDVVVPPAVVRSFVERFPPASPVHFTLLEGVDHDCCWMERIPSFLQKMLR
ncbi:MAG: hypothetical protein HW380_3297 [Magnetococcales bacterium]|nr:hypothetical protein [Magnetococcales bacterium]